VVLYDQQSNLENYLGPRATMSELAQTLCDTTLRYGLSVADLSKYPGRVPVRRVPGPCPVGEGEQGDPVLPSTTTRRQPTRRAVRAASRRAEVAESRTEPAELPEPEWREPDHDGNHHDREGGAVERELRAVAAGAGGKLSSSRSAAEKTTVAPVKRELIAAASCPLA